MSIVALEITPKRILLAAGRSAANRPLELSHLIEIPIEADLGDEDIGAALKQVVQDRGLAKHDAVVVLSRSQSELREIDFPPVPDEELPDMVTFKAKSDFASFSDRWLLDFVSLDHDQSKPRRVLASAISPDVQERIERILAPTGLRLKQMVLRPFAIMDLLAKRNLSDQPRIVVSPGENFTDILVARAEKLLTTRTIRVPEGHSADQRNRQLVSEVRRTIASSKRQLNGETIHGMLLIDREKSNRELIGNLSQRLKLETEIVNPLDDLPRIDQASEAIDAPWPFAALIGSIVDAGSDRVASIDFLNPTKREEVVPDHRKWYLYGGVAAVVACLMLLVGWWTLRSQSSEIADLTDSLASQVELNKGVGNRPSVDTTLARIKMLDDWQKGNVQWLDELDQLSQRFLTADEAMVSKLDAAVKRNLPTVEIAGKIVSNEQDRKLFDSLEARPFIVTPTKADFVGGSEYPYSFGKRLGIDLESRDWLEQINAHVLEFKKLASRGTAVETKNSTNTGRAH